MKSAEIRQAFLSFFAEKQHTVVPSSSLVPSNDPTLLFTNAGMVPFKDVFLGDEKRPYVRATSSQRCVRAGGKHNDLENVGYTARHHTFFEMLGNFSFGDYFKREAITYAWEFLTSDRWLNLPQERLWVTVYEEDDEAYQIWAQEVGVPAERLIRIGDNKGGRYQSDNFWSMGETGPCGPCTEIFYDHGEHIWGGPPGSPEEDGDRYIEIWNNVFMQFNRSADGRMNPLPAPSVDTGMGLERITAVMQHVNSNYEIDSFQTLLKAAAAATDCDDLQNKSLRVIADHLRSCAFLVVDGVLPSNEGRGYVLRRIMRRAIRHGHKLGQSQSFFHTLVPALVDEMHQAYPELAEQQAKIAAAFLAEENQFAKTLDKGMAVLENAITAAEQASGQPLTTLEGELVFTLYDTYGFPLDLTADIARERNLSVDEAGYNTLMARQKEQSRAAGSFKVDYSAQLTLDVATTFLGYEQLQSTANIVAILQEGDTISHLENGQEACLVLDQTPFYAESGGQVGDKGVIYTEAGRFDVRDCLKQGDTFLHIGALSEGHLAVDQSVTAHVLEDLRAKTTANHSATHLLHAALRYVLGDQVVQKGSLCDPERLRFDFAYGEAVSLEQMRTVEQLVNAQIRANTEVSTDVTDMETAKAKGAMALFGEKYTDSVRVLSMGNNDFSVELCGGTHVERTGDIGLLRIVSESGVAAGVRRIEAVTGEAAIAMAYQADDLIRSVCQTLKAKPDTLMAKTEALKAELKSLEKALSSAKSRLAQAASAELIQQVKTVSGVSVLAVQIEGVDAKGLASTADHLKEKLGDAVMLLAASEGDKVALLASVSKPLTPKLKAGALIQTVAPMVGGKGGGRPDMARGAGTQPDNIPTALQAVAAWVEEQLA